MTALTIPELLTELARGESQHREFKRQLGHPESIAGEIVAFANSEGGCLYFGVDDDGSIVGLTDTATVLQSLAHLRRDRCIPPVSPVLEQYAVEGRDIVALTVMPALNRLKPYRNRRGPFLSAGGPGQAGCDGPGTGAHRPGGRRAALR